MERIEYFDKYIAPDLPDFVKQGLELFRSRHGLFLTIHAMSSRWYMPDGSFLFSNCMAHHAEYCVRKRYSNRKYNKLCLQDCAARVEQVCLRSGEPFLHHCWKGVTELIVPFVWDGVLELIFYVGPFRGPEVPAKEEFRTGWNALPEFPAEKRDPLIQECLLLGTAFHARLMQENLSAQLILQVHDELIVEAPEHEVAQVEQLLKEEMEKAVSLKVQLKADVGVGKTWIDAK